MSATTTGNLTLYIDDGDGVPCASPVAASRRKGRGVAGGPRGSSEPLFYDGCPMSSPSASSVRLSVSGTDEDSTLPLTAYPHESTFSRVTHSAPHTRNANERDDEDAASTSGKDTGKNAAISRSGGSFFGLGKFLRSATGGSFRKAKGKAKDVRPPSVSTEHMFVPVSGSDVTWRGAECDVCRRAFAKPSSTLSVAQATDDDIFQCQYCEIYVHNRCKDSSGSCSMAKHHTPGQQPKSWRSSIGSFQFHIPARSESTLTSPSCSIASSGVGESPSLSVAAPTSAHKTFIAPDLHTEEYDNLGLWTEEMDAWSFEHEEDAKQLSEKEVKRQNIIHELYLTEKHHVETLGILKLAYRESFIKYDLVSALDLDVLCCDVVDTLLAFHIRLLRALRDRKRESIVVDAIGDILEFQFSETNGLRTQIVDAYIKFCWAKEDATKLYKQLVITNARFQAYVEFLAQLSGYRGRDLPQCLLLAAQRITKYPLMVDELIKTYANDDARRESLQRAAASVRETAKQMDDGLARLFIERQWHEMRTRLDPHSTATLFAEPFTMSDLTMFEDRVAKCFGRVLWQNANRKPAVVHMLLFDDILVFLQERTDHKLQYFSQDKKEAVISLATMMCREKATKNQHAKALFLIVGSERINEMYEISCNPHALQVWQHAITHAVAAARPVRRLNHQRIDSTTTVPIVTLEKDTDSNVPDGNTPSRPEHRKLKRHPTI